ncbi:MAG: SDR family NAD(P)-dependent oxidoreductase [Chloroflexi bacterium]|nr:SDR family NAD(P)-dependent oxidoreductase [Chloroflexota bacterium]
MSIQTALITGAGGGMGSEIARQLAAAGFHCLLTGRREGPLEEVVAEIEAAGGSASAHPLDVTDSVQIQALVDRRKEECLDALICCAGDWLIKPLEAVTDAEIEHILAVNLVGPMLMARSFLPQLRRSENATILNIGSIASMRYVPQISIYTAAKTGLRGFTGALAEELRPERIRCVLLSPGPADTPMRWAATPQADPDTLVTPETIARTVAHIVTLPPGTTVTEFLLISQGYGEDAARKMLDD